MVDKDSRMLPKNQKFCKTCKTIKLISEFHKRDGGRPTSSCKLCRNAASKAYYEKYFQIKGEKQFEKQLDILRRQSRYAYKSACDILKDHHDDLQSDPERLTCDFMKKIIGINCEKS